MLSIIKIKTYSVKNPMNVLEVIKSIIKNKYITNSNIFINVDIDKANKQILISVHGKIDMRKIYEKFCKQCKEMHCSFYINEEYNCSRCNTKTFIKRLKEDAIIIKKYIKNNIV